MEKILFVLFFIKLEHYFDLFFINFYYYYKEKNKFKKIKKNRIAYY